MMLWLALIIASSRVWNFAGEETVEDQRTSMAGTSATQTHVVRYTSRIQIDKEQVS